MRIPFNYLQAALHTPFKNEYISTLTKSSSKVTLYKCLYLNKPHMKTVRLTFYLLIFTLTLCAQNTSKGEVRSANQIFTIIEGNTQDEWTKGEVESPPTASNQIMANDFVSFNASSDGIFITITSGKNKVKLFALTGQMLLDGELTQGRFFIPTKRGIYFLRVNTKSYKVVCK
jgi:hypothetical protein